MPNLYTAIEINAPKAVVWDVLIQKEQWFRWNTFLYDCDPARPFRQGTQVSLALRRLEGDEETEFQPRILLLQPTVCLRWISQIPGFRSEHVFELQEVGFNRTQYTHRERFSGVLSRMFLPFIRQDEKQGLKRMAYQLKRHIEGRTDNRRRRAEPGAGGPLPPSRYYQ